MDWRYEPSVSLHNDLPYLLKLEALRIQSRDLRNKLLNRMANHDWRHEETPRLAGTSICLLRRVKHLCWLLEYLPKNREGNFPPLPKICALADGISKTYDHGKGGRFFARGDSATQVYFAAHYLRAATDEADLTCFTREMVLAHYRIVRELYTVSDPDWAFGGARAGTSVGTASSFVTQECARALGHLANTFKATATLLKALAAHALYAEEISNNGNSRYMPLREEWCKTELNRISMAVRLLVSDNNGRTLLPIVHVDANESWSELTTRVVSAATAYVAGSVKTLGRALSEIEAFRKEERIVTVGDDAADYYRSSTVLLSETGHAYSLKLLQRTHNEINRASLAVTSATSRPQSIVLRTLAEPFESLAVGNRRLTRPTAQFVYSRMITALFEGHLRGGTPDIADLAFSAATYGAITDRWPAEVYDNVIEMLCKHMDAGGRFPVARPFHFVEDRYLRLPANAHVLSAFSQILHGAAAFPRSDVLDRMLRFFADAGQGGPGAFGGPAPPARRSARAPGSPWQTAAAVLCLDRVSRLLDATINRVVQRHLRSTTPSENRALDSLDLLMCSDLGLSSIPPKGGRPRRETVTTILVRMHAQLANRRVRHAVGGERLCSLILYGPPGTGKTTLVETLARAAGRTLVLVTPGDILRRGAEGLEDQTNAVMSALAMLTGCVVLFDEFDAVLRSRDEEGARVGTVFEFLTGDMLPKLALLNQAAQMHGSTYILATNYVDRLDAAAIRQGRFDRDAVVLSPDLPSRVCRLVSQFKRWCRDSGQEQLPKNQGVQKRLIELLAETAGMPAVYLTRKGVFTSPGKALVSNHSPWGFLVGKKGARIPRFSGDEPAPLAKRDPPKVVSELAVQQATDVSIVTSWDRRCAELVMKKDFSWLDLLAIFDSNKEIDEILANWSHRFETARRRRLGIVRTTTPGNRTRRRSGGRSGGRPRARGGA